LSAAHRRREPGGQTEIVFPSRLDGKEARLTEASARRLQPAADHATNDRIGRPTAHRWYAV